jgi:hypothetical protein
MSLYQIVVFANGSDSHADTLRATIERSFSDLGIPLRMLSFLDEASVSARDHKSPTVSAYFGLTLHPAAAAPALSNLIKDAALVVPIVPTLDRFSEFVPNELRPINGMGLRPEDPQLERVSSRYDERQHGC